MRSDNAALSTVQDALGLGAATVDVAYTAVNSAIEVVNQIKAKLVAAREPGIDAPRCKARSRSCRSSSRASPTPRRSRATTGSRSTPAAGSYNGTKNIVASFTRTGSAVSVQTIAIDTSAMDLFDANAGTTNAAAGILDANRKTTDGTIDNDRATFTVYGLNISALTDSTADLATLDSYISGADAAIKEMTTAAASLGAVKSRIGLQQDFVKNLMNALDRGIGALVDADMNEESTKLQALQVKQQLGIQALSIANALEPEHPAPVPITPALCSLEPLPATPCAGVAILFRCLLQAGARPRNSRARFMADYPRPIPPYFLGPR